MIKLKKGENLITNLLSCRMFKTFKNLFYFFLVSNSNAVVYSSPLLTVLRTCVSGPYKEKCFKIR